MSDAGTQQFDTAFSPISDATVVAQGQLGPQIVGSGIMNFRGPGTLYLTFYPQSVGQSSVRYANNFGNPNIPLEPGVPTKITNVQSLNIAFEVNPGSDMKLAWALTP